LDRRILGHIRRRDGWAGQYLVVVVDGVIATGRLADDDDDDLGGGVVAKMITIIILERKGERDWQVA
jgi:hypothetical protein